LWNACRFRQMQGDIDPNANPYDHELSSYAHLILKQTDELIEKVDKYYDNYQFNQVAGTLYGFVWTQFCSRYLEAAKADFSDESSATRSGTLATFDFVLSRILRLLHPFCPFITEELWLDLNYGEDTIQFANWPQRLETNWDEAAATQAEKIFDALDQSRSLRGEFGISAKQKVKFSLKLSGELASGDRAILESLMSAEPLELITDVPARTPMVLTTLGDLFLPLDGVVDVDKEIARIEKALIKVNEDIAREDKKLSNTRMIENAPADKVAEWRQVLAGAEERKVKLKEQLSHLK
ncbi:MAG: class I tRNA ligase family protein, partial [Verrucomicrobiota bacterium]